MKKLTIGGIVTLIIILSSATTYYIQDLKEKTSCRNGFDYVDSGEFEGYYKCVTKTRARYELCFEVYNSTNTENYWCRKGKLVEVPVEIKVKASRTEICSPKGCAFV